MKIFNFKQTSQILWAAAMLFIPVTSFRWFPFLGETTYVRPLALYPLAVLIPLLLIQWLRGNIKLNWSGALIPLGMLILFLFTATALGAILAPIPLRGQLYFGRAIRALLTVFIGLSFFVAAMWMNKDEADLRFTLTWLFAGLSLNIAWSALQQITFMGFLEKEMVTHWQRAFSMRELIRSNRISGMAYEPAWLAGQLATVFFPWLFAAVLTNYRATKFKWLEPILLVLSIGVLLATFSRGGLLVTIAAGGLTFLQLGRDVMSAMWQWFAGGFRARMGDLILRIGMILLAAAILAGAFLFLSQRKYISRLWQIDAETLSEYMVDIRAGARGAYTAAALEIFEDRPWTGVGFGASGFYIYENLPNWSLTNVPEIAKQLNPENKLYPNPKNIYARLLSETGLIGFTLYLAFQFYLLGDMLALLLRKTKWKRFAATAGVFAWFAITFYNFTQDSLATPNLWLVTGVLAGLSANSLLKENS